MPPLNCYPEPWQLENLSFQKSSVEMMIIETPRMTAVLTLHWRTKGRVGHRRSKKHGPCLQGVYCLVGGTKLSNAVLSAEVLPLPNGGEADTDLTVPVLEGLARPERARRTSKRDQGHSGVFLEGTGGSSACCQTVRYFSGDKTVGGGVNPHFLVYDLRKNQLGIL